MDFSQVDAPQPPGCAVFDVVAVADSVAGALGCGATKVDDVLVEVAAGPASIFSGSSVGSIGGWGGGIAVLIR